MIKKDNKKNIFLKGLKLLVFLVVILGLGFGIYYINGKKEEVKYENILVLKNDIDSLKKVKEFDLEMRKIESSYANGQLVKNYSQIDGKVPVIDLKKGQIIYSNNFKKDEMIIREDEMIYSFSINRLNSYPQSTRKGDTIIIYAIKKNDKLYDVQYEYVPELINLGETYVRYIKDGHNREITTVVEEGMVKNEERNVGSGVATQVEVKAKKTLVERILKMEKEGYEFTITRK
jgi:hypothetical protein